MLYSIYIYFKIAAIFPVLYNKSLYIIIIIIIIIMGGVLGQGSIPRWGTKIPSAAWCGQKIKALFKKE